MGIHTSFLQDNRKQENVGEDLQTITKKQFLYDNRSSKIDCNFLIQNTNKHIKLPMLFHGAGTGRATLTVLYCMPQKKQSPAPTLVELLYYFER